MRQDDVGQLASEGVVDTLLESLLLVCRLHGVATSRDALAAGLPLRDGKMTPSLVKRAANRVNLATTTLLKKIIRQN